MLAATPLSRNGMGSGFEDAMNGMRKLVSEDEDLGSDSEDVIGAVGKSRVVWVLVNLRSIQKRGKG